MNRRLTTIALTTVLALGAAACGADGDGISLADIRARAQVQSVGVSAIYMDVTNDGDEDVELVGVSVPGEIAGYTELHETRMVDDDGMADDEMTDDEMADDGMTDDEMADDAMTDDGGMSDMEGGMSGMEGMEMVQVQGIPVPAGETVNLEPGGLHVMLLDLAATLEDGDTFEATLEFDDGTSQTVDVEVTSTP